MAHPIAINQPTVATPVRASHSHGQIAARLRALVEGVGLAGNFDLLFTKLETLYRNDAPIGAVRFPPIRNHAWLTSVE